MNLILMGLFLFCAHLGWANELKIFVITPQFPIDWNSPRSLAITTGLDSINDDYAPIGHFAVEIKCQNKNRYGVKHVLTGMERKNKRESQQITLEKKLGLGSLVYPFQGSLQSSETTLKEIILATQDQRLKVISIPTTSSRCQQMLSFLEEWIKNASYKVYGGGKRTGEGEGAGCADFAMEFFKIATNKPVPSAWLVKKHVPKELIGDGEKQLVPFTDILKTNTWGERSNSLYFEIADTNLVDTWITNNLGEKNGLYLFDRHTKDGSHYILPRMRYFYHSSQKPISVWRSIEVTH